MSSAEPDELTQQWRELMNQQAELSRSWLDQWQRLEPPGGWSAFGFSPEKAGSLPVEIGELWRSWMELGGSLGRSLPTMTDSTGVAAGTLGRLLDPVSLSLVGGSQVGEAIRRMTEGPRFADVGLLERRTAKGLELWLEVQAAARGYEQVVAGGWMLAGRRFSEELAKRRTAGGEPLPAKEALRLWLDTANQALLETHRSDDFLTAQRRLLRSGMDFLLAERELVESLVEPAGLPTRTEIDEVHRSVQQLKRRVRALEKEAREREARDGGREPAKAGTAAVRPTADSGATDSGATDSNATDSGATANGAAAGTTSRKRGTR